MSVAIVDVGCANLASMRFALERLGARYHVTSDAAEIAEASRVIFPGVGAARYAADRIDALGLRETLQSLTQPLLGVCLGMQLLFEASEEGDAQGLGRVSGVIRRLKPQAGEPWPHMGWSRIAKRRDSRLLHNVDDGAYAYFVHGYAAPISAKTTGTAKFDEKFSATIEADSIYGCQFHPERSAETGALILKNFLEAPC